MSVLKSNTVMGEGVGRGRLKSIEYEDRGKKTIETIWMLLLEVHLATEIHGKSLPC